MQDVTLTLSLDVTLTYPLLFELVDFKNPVHYGGG